MMHIADAWHHCDALARKLAAEFPEVNVTCIRDIYGRCSFSLETDSDDAYERAQAALTARVEAPSGDEERPALRDFLARSWLQRLQPDSALGQLISQLRKPLVLRPGEPTNVFVVERLLSHESWLVGAGQNPKDWPPVVGFYSFKGGVGRTTATALTALTLAREGKRVVLVDLDLEAPGIESLFFEPGDDDSAGAEIRAGVVDYLLERAVLGSASYRPDIDDFVLPFSDAAIAASGGSLVIVPAGKLDSSYTERLGRLNLADSARGHSPDNPLRALIGDLVAWRQTDIVLVDCRTGFTDLGGMTLNGLTDLDVLVFRAGEADRRYLPIVLDHILRFRDESKAADELAQSFLIVFTMAELPGKTEEAEQYVTELRELASRACWTRIFERFKDTGYTYPSLMARDTPYEPVPHDALLIPYLRAFAQTSSVADMLRLQAERPERPYDALAHRLWNVKLARKLREDTAAPARLPRSTSEELRQHAIEAITKLTTEARTGEPEFTSEEDLRTKFLPRAAYRTLLDPRAFLVLGQKGSGKSTLFQLLRYPRYLQAVSEHVGLDSAAVTSTQWEIGFAEEPGFATSDDALHALEITGEDPDLLTRLWRLLLVHRLAQLSELPQCPGAPLPGLATIGDCITQVKNHEVLSAANHWLQELDRALERDGRLLCLSYDALDTALTRDPRRRGVLVSALVAYWQQAMRYLPRIRAKLFLREDIWNREVTVTDKAKIREGIDRVKITWDGVDIYRAVLKRLGHHEAIQELLDQAGQWTPELTEMLETPLGFIPPADEEWVKKSIQALAGETMASGKWGFKKGFVYTWLLDHISDAAGVLRPRNALLLFSEAAKLQGTPTETGPILEPRSFRDALRGAVSETAVADLEEEYRVEWSRDDGTWIPKQLMAFERIWPVSEEGLVTYLHDRLGIPRTDAEELVERMITAGFFERRRTRKAPSASLQIPDIYLYGLGLTRHG